MPQKNFTFRTQNLLKNGVAHEGRTRFDSFIQIMASSAYEANKKLEGYINYGKKIGWYK